MFPGSKMVGNVRVENKVVIAANSVVINYIPNNCIVGGIPARILSEDSSSFFYWKKQSCLLIISLL